MKEVIYKKSQLRFLVILRVLIGWHFLYEGIVKLYSESWTSAGYLNSSEWIFSWFFEFLASTPTIVSIVDTFNIAAQLIIGLGLILGLFARFNAILGILLLGMYYLAHPPLVGLSPSPGIGNYLIVDRNLIEIAALAVLYVFPSSKQIGLDGLLFRKNKEQAKNEILINS